MHIHIVGCGSAIFCALVIYFCQLNFSDFVVYTVFNVFIVVCIYYVIFTC